MASQTSSSPRSIVALVVLLGAVGAGAGGVYLADQFYYKPLREQKQLIENLSTILDTLTRDHRIAEIVATEQTANPPTTTVRFQEVDEKDNAVGPPVTCKLDGDEVYFDTLVIKFEESFKPLNDPQITEALKQKGAGEGLAGKSIILFRRIFSDKQKPEAGCPLDTPGATPAPYKTPETPFEHELWQDFWKLANDPDLAKSRGVRAAHGEAVSMKIQPDKVYVIEKRADGDLTIRPEKIRPVMRK